MVSRQVLNCSMTQCTCEMIATSAFLRNLEVVGIWGRLWGWVRDLHVLDPEAAPLCFVVCGAAARSAQPERGQAVPVAGTAAAVVPAM